MILRVLLRFVVSLAAASIIIFLLLRAVPGDPARVALGVTATDDAVAALAAQLGTCLLYTSLAIIVGRQAEMYERLIRLACWYDVQAIQCCHIPQPLQLPRPAEAGNADFHSALNWGMWCEKGGHLAPFWY